MERAVDSRWYLATAESEVVIDRFKAEPSRWRAKILTTLPVENGAGMRAIKERFAKLVKTE